MTINKGRYYLVTLQLAGTPHSFSKYCDTLRECDRVIKRYSVVSYRKDADYSKCIYIQKFGAQGKSYNGVVKAWTKLAKKRK